MPLHQMMTGAEKVTFCGTDDAQVSLPTPTHGCRHCSELALPESTPWVSKALGIGAAASYAYVIVAPPEAFFSVGGLLAIMPLTAGSLWTTMWPDTVVSVAVLLLLCSRQERLLGSGRFAAFWLLAVLSHIAASMVLFTAGVDSLSSTLSPGAPVLALSSATAAVLALNWRMLSARQRASMAAVAAGAGLALLAVESADASWWPMVVVGAALGWFGGPKFLIMREPIIPGWLRLLWSGSFKHTCSFPCRCPSVYLATLTLHHRPPPARRPQTCPSRCPPTTRQSTSVASWTRAPAGVRTCPRWPSG